MGFFDLLISTVMFRPYVFVFLVMFLVSATFKVGPRKAVLFLLSGWFIAFVSEFSSVRNGIPFGLYHYIPAATADRELWFWGIPLIDPVSFPFLAYASWSMARVFLSRSTGVGPFFSLQDTSWRGDDSERFSLPVLFLGAVFFMLLDVVVDPVALQGDKWFLGKIYFYPDPGPYFGVTIENFVGWFLVGLVILLVWKYIDSQSSSLFMLESFPTVDLWGPVLYYSVAIFNVYMAFHIGEYALGWAGVFIFLPVTALFLFRIFRLR